MSVYKFAVRAWYGIRPVDSEHTNIHDAYKKLREHKGMASRMSLYKILPNGFDWKALEILNENMKTEG